MADVMTQRRTLLRNNVDSTHFGFKTVASQPRKVSLVANVFHNVAAKYDVMNDCDVFRHSPFVETLYHRLLRRAARPKGAWI